MVSANVLITQSCPLPLRCLQVKLLFHRIRPVFVFDGGAPALKGRTLAARRKLRSEGTDSSVRKTAQRILASQLKKHKVCTYVCGAVPCHANDVPASGMGAEISENGQQ